jgi:hypothetical protein
MEFFLEGREVTEFCREHPGAPLELPPPAPVDNSEPPPMNNPSGESNPQAKSNDVATAEPPPPKTETERRSRPRRVATRPTITARRPAPRTQPKPAN